jgi:aspartate-semialdehyde dehydrogenase
MTYSVLLLGATGTVGSRVAPQLAAHASELKRVAFLTPSASASADKEAKYASTPLERVVGAFDDPKSYEGFDIVISAVGDPLCEDQIKFADAAFEAGVKHFYPAECKLFYL